MKPKNTGITAVTHQSAISIGNKFLSIEFTEPSHITSMIIPKGIPIRIKIGQDQLYLLNTLGIETAASVNKTTPSEIGQILSFAVNSAANLFIKTIITIAPKNDAIKYVCFLLAFKLTPISL